MSNEGIRGRDKKKLALENLDKVVGGTSSTRPAQGTMSQQQLLDAIDAAKATEAAAEATDTKGGMLRSSTNTQGAALEQVAKDVASEIAKPGSISSQSQLDQTIWKLHDKIGQDLGIDRQAAISVGYAMAYRAVFEGGSATRDESAYELKATFFATNGGRYDVMNHVIGGMAVEAAFSGDLGKFASRATDATAALIENAHVGLFALPSFLSKAETMLENAFKMVETLPGGKALPHSPLEAEVPGSSAELLKTLVKAVACDAAVKQPGARPDTMMIDVLTHLRDATVELFKPGAKATADTLRLVKEAVNDCSRIVEAGNLTAGGIGRNASNLVQQLTSDVSKNYVAAMVHSPGSAAEQFSKQLFVALLDDLKGFGSSPGNRAVLDELSKMARLNSTNAINDLVEFAKGGMGPALSALENLARTGTRNALPAIETLVRAGTAGALDGLSRLGLANADGAGELIARLAKDQVGGAMSLVERLVRANIPGAAGILENLVKQNVAGAMPMLESLTRQNAPGTLDAIESLARQRNAQALALLETMAREGSFTAMSRLQQAGAYGQIEQLAKDGVRGALEVFGDLAKRDPADGYAAMERLIQANAPGAMDQLQTLVRQGWTGGMDCLERLARGNVANAMAIVSSIALERTPGSVDMVERLVQAGTPGSATILANMVFRNIEPLEKVEAMARQGGATAFQALDQLAESQFTGALGAMARVTRFQLDEVKNSLKAVLEAGMRAGNGADLNPLASEKAGELQRSLNLDAATATALAKAQLYLAGQEAVEGKPHFVRMGIEAMTGSDAAVVIQGLTVQATLYGDTSKYMNLITKLVVSKAAPGDESKWLNVLETAGDKATMLVQKFRVTNALYELARDPGNEEAQKRMIAEGVLFVVTPSQLGHVTKGIAGVNFGLDYMEPSTMIGLVYGGAAAALFDRVGISDEVRQTARALKNLVTNVEDAFVDQATRTVINPMYDLAKNTGKNAYELGKALGSGNMTDIGNSMANLVKGVVTDYVDGVKTYFVETFHSLHYTRDIMENLLSDLGATPYAERAFNAAKDGLTELGTLAEQGSKQAVAELGKLVSSTGKFAEDAAAELLRVADKALPGPVRDEALRVIHQIERLGGPVAEVFYTAAGHFKDGANAVADEFRKGYDAVSDLWDKFKSIF